MTKLVFTAFFLLGSASLAQNAAPSQAGDYHLRQSANQRTRTFHPKIQVPRNLTAGIYQQSIDHSGLMPGQTFNQRYWINTQYATNPATAPVIFHICGEGDCTQDYFLHDNAIQWAQSMHANLAYLEHRYYGESQPFTDTSTAHLRYLTLDNVFEDLASFQKWIASTQGWQGKWVTVGGSYSGTLSALYRQKHPELVAGALAASAPMISGTGQDATLSSDEPYLTSTSLSGDPSDRQWFYQACTTFGFWETDDNVIFNAGPAACNQIFGSVPLVNSTLYNTTYEAPFISANANSPSNILFTYGSADIWTSIGISQNMNVNPNITILVIDGAGHHFDLNPPTSSDSAAVKAARQEFLTLASKWVN